MADFDDAQQLKKIEEIRRKEEESFVEHISKRFNLPYIDLTGVNIETDALTIIPEQEARATRVAAFKLLGKDLYIAVKSPNLPETKRILEKLEQKYNLGIHLVSERSLSKAWERYQDVSSSTVSEKGMLDISGEELKKISEQIRTNKDIAQSFNDVISKGGSQTTTRIMEIIFGGAIATGSSDVHIEAQTEQVRIRFRQDGVLQDIATFDHDTYKKVLSRIKLLSEMKITQTQNAQDGRFTIDFDDKKIEVRVSVIPSAYGESFVMRILNPDGIKVGVENLGIEPRLYEILLKEIEKPNGMILTTGPTGSGKTTTLYSFMNKVYSPEVKILTIEDPIEYHLGGISQTQVNRQKGYTFLSGLRAALRQDPDIVMVGEIRDSETATIAVNASLTGHLVLSTLHTNSAAGVIPRLLDLGVSPQILAAALSVSLAQRLVRKVCTNCKYEVEPTEQEEYTLREILREAEKNKKPLHEYGIAVDQKITLHRGRGCDVCNGTGYKGRIGLFEAIITDEKIEELLNKKPSEQEVRRVAEKQGLLNMREDGTIKILNGITSFEEVAKVINLDIQNLTKTDDDSETTPITERADTNIHNVIWEQSSADQKPPQSSTQHKPTSLIENPPRVQPDSFLNACSIEVSLLVDYLKQLETQQRISPDVAVADQIRRVQKTILDLLKKYQPEEIFPETRDPLQTHRELNNLHNELEKVYEDKQKNPTVNISEKLRTIREDIEHHQTPLTA